MTTSLSAMSNAGWYPDPSGQPHTFRYWDGQAWSHETSPSPYVAPPGSAAPPPPPPAPPAPPFPPTQAMPSVPPPAPGYGSGTGGPGWQTPIPTPYAGGPPPSGGSGSGAKIALILLVVVLVAGAAVGGFFGVRALTDDSDGSSADPTSSATPSTEESESEEPPSTDPSPAEPSAPTAIMAACSGATPEGGRPAGAVLRGGGLSVPRPEGYEPMAVESAFTFADQVVTVARQIEDQWIALYALGGVPTAAGFSGPDQAAETVISCMAASDSFYRSFESRTDLVSEAVTIGGHSGWQITSELRINDPQINQEGDHATVIVVETDTPGEYGLFVSVVPIGDQQLIDQQESVVGSLQVG